MRILGKIFVNFVLAFLVSVTFISASVSKNTVLISKHHNLIFDDRLIGTWQIKFKGTECDGYVEFTLDADGNYASETACEDGSYPLKMVGTWTLIKEGLVRLDITDWSPKIDGGVKMNGAQTFQYIFVNDNRMKLDGGRIANRMQ